MWSLSQRFGNLVLTFALMLGGASARAETFPNKPVHILVPYAAGGAVDVLARTLGQSLAKSWGQQPVIDNRPGAGGVIASQALAQSAPDGYTLILVASGHPLNQFIYPSLPYDTFKDFTAITEIASSPLARRLEEQSVQDPEGCAGGGTQRAGLALLRHGGQRHVVASRGRAPEIHGRCEDRRRSL